MLQLPGARAWLWQHTGEEEFPAQVKGLTDLASRPAAPAACSWPPMLPCSYADVNPFGVNVFLEQEADPAKRALAVQMAADAGYHWLRQEFPWEDIEIHGKGDFEDRRHEPYRSAWEKYDQIVDLAEQNGMELIVRLSNPPGWTRARARARTTSAPLPRPTTCRTSPTSCAAVVEPLPGTRPLLPDLERAEHLPGVGQRDRSIPKRMSNCSRPAPRRRARPTRTP